MAWANPRTWSVGEIVTAAIQNTHVRDLFRYLKGLDGVPTIESGLIIDNTDGDEYLKLPLLSTAECTSVLDAEGEFAFDEQTHDLKWYNGSAVISAKDIASLSIASQATGDVVVASSATAWKRVALGAASKYFRVNGAGDDIEWASGPTGAKIWAQPHYAGGGGVLATWDGVYYCGTECPDAQSSIVYWTIAIPSDFVTLSKAVVMVVAQGTGNIYRHVNTNFAANGEARNTHTDSIAGATVAVTDDQVCEDDISAAFTGVAAGDYVGVRWWRQGDAEDDTVGAEVLVTGLLIEYT